jgi:ubiquinone/menaquinone biosynthesis C-methylase UbiE
MKTQWDYTELATAYLKRPDYADSAIDSLLAQTGVARGARVCDVGAGVAHLTLKLLQRGLDVVPVEPNDAMRALGSQRTRGDFPSTSWREGTGEQTNQASDAFDLVTFGSSFNVTDRPVALLESRRILRANGWFACMYNHRDLADPLQDSIERVIREHVADYQYGTRREDQTPVIEQSRLFGPVQLIDGRIVQRQSRSDCLTAWRSHATLQRQAGARFSHVVSSIEALLAAQPGDMLEVPYTTRIWFAQVR